MMRDANDFPDRIHQKSEKQKVTEVWESNNVAGPSPADIRDSL